MGDAAERLEAGEQAIDAIVCRALDLPAELRSDFLRDTCGDDPELLARVRSLIAAGEATDPLLRSGGAASPALLAELPARAAPEPGAEIGRYRVLREIGRGGMGAVYLATRADGHYEQRVALKILPRWADAAALDRFARERQILADLEHPGIARLLDGGLTPRGEPYLVMELVDGVRIDRYCRDRRVALRRRVELLVEVCRAVEAAHRRLVVHRDLKPANILVNDRGEARLLDFGIAKLLADDGVQATRTSTRCFTPQYASPEQARGETITVASDVYQLGLLAYELLSGRRPYELSGAGALAAERAICRRQPPPPSARLAEAAALPAGGAPRPSDLEGDLDTIVLKALRKEPDRRYASVTALREDLERYLTGFPVSARPDSLGYRLGKLLRRHAVAASALGFAVLLVAVLTVAFALRLAAESEQTRRAAELAEQRRVLAEQRRAESEEAVEFLVGLFESSDPYANRPAGVAEEQGAEPTARDLLRWGAERLETSFADRPLIRARLLHTTGRLYSRMELFDEAEPLLREALALRRAAPQDQRLEIAELEADLGRHFTASRRSEEAEAALRRALALRTAVLGERHELVAATQVDLATLLHREGRYDESESWLERAVTLHDGRAAPPSEQRVHILLRLGQSRLERGRVAEARATFERALATARELESPDGPLVAAGLKTVARCAVEQGEPEAALPLFHQSLEIYERRFGVDSIQASNVRQNLAFTLYGLGETDEAFRLFREALVTVEATLGPHSLDALALRFNLASMRLEQDEAEATLPELDALTRSMQEHLGPTHKLTLLAELTLGRALTESGRLREAEPLVASSLERLEATFGPSGQYVSVALLGLARIHRLSGEPAEAEPLLRRALAIRRSTMSDTAPEVVEAASELAEVLDEMGRGARG